MGLDSGIYKFFLLLHFITIIVGFGPTILAGVFGTKAKARGGREGQAIAEATFEVVDEWATKFIYLIPVFGILLVLVSDDAWQFSDAWISFSFLLYFVALGVVHGVHRPNIQRMNALMAQLNTSGPAAATGGGPPPQVAELEERGKRAAMVGGFLNLLLVALLVLMIWKPGA
jgi:uncharacterized membrane protein